MSNLRCEFLGWPETEPTVRLDYRRFSYAGKFVVGSTGKAVIRDADRSAGSTLPPIDERLPEGHSERAFDRSVLAAISFDEDRTDSDVLVFRYVTVRRDRRGEGLGPMLVRFVVDRAQKRGYDRCRIAVNNPFAYEALYRAGFAFTGETSGMAELVLERPTAAPASRDGDRYRAGLELFLDRETIQPRERSFLERRIDADSPTTLTSDRP